jgi:hypothetical protein
LTRANRPMLHEVAVTVLLLAAVTGVYTLVIRSSPKDISKMTAPARAFGRKLTIPSTLHILHDLLVFSAAEDAKRRLLADTVAEHPAGRKS